MKNKKVNLYAKLFPMPESTSLSPLTQEVEL